MSLESLKRARAECRLARVIPYSHLNTPSVFECKDGSLGGTFKIKGIAASAVPESHLNRLGGLWHQALSGCDARFMQMVTLYRQKEKLTLSGEFNEAFAKRVDARYHSQFAQQSLYRNHWFLTTLLKPDAATALKGLKGLSRMKSHLSPQGERDRRREARLKQLEDVLARLGAQLSPFSPTRLGVNDLSSGESELLRFLSLIPNGDLATVYRLPASLHESTALYPREDLSRFLGRKRLFFGDSIQFQGAHPDDCRFALMLSIKQYGTHTTANLLDALEGIESEFIATHSFAPLSRESALKEVSLKRGKLINAEDAGFSQIEALSLLEDELACGVATLGFHHHTLMLLAESIETLNRHLQDAGKAFDAAGLVVVRETLGTEPAFLAQMPGNAHFITRPALITSHNFTDFCSLHNSEPGFRKGNHLQEAVTVLKSTARTPVYFNFHLKGGSKDNPAPGHTAVFGATNAGKNTLVAFLDAQLSRFNHRTFFLDRNEASKIYCLSHEKSRYTTISPEKANECPMNPLALADTAENRQFLKGFLAELIVQEGEASPPSALCNALSECVDYAYESLREDCRTLSHALSLLPGDFPRWPELRRFLRASDTHSEGEYAWLFDNHGDALQFEADKTGFDLTWLMDSAKPFVATPVYALLLYRIRKALDGRLTAIVLDEAWQALNSPFWVNALSSDLPTIRKLNGFFIFMTQSPETVYQSLIAPQLLANVVTRLFFPNARANRTTYEAFGLNEAEFNFIAQTNPISRQFLYCQDGQNSVPCLLDLSQMQDEIRVFSANKKSVAQMDKLIKTHGASPSHWLDLFLAGEGA